MAEETKNTPQKSKRELFIERLKAKYPEDNFDDEEVFYGRIGEDYDDAESKLAEYKKHEDGLSSMFAADPRSAAYLNSWRNGADPAVELIRLFGDEVLEALNDPDKQEEIAEARKEYLDKVSKSKELENEYNQNLEASLETLAAFQEENGLSDDELDNVAEFIMTIITDGINGKISRETMDLALKAINHDSDIAAASHEAEVRGKNAKITEKLRKEGDGTAVMDGQNGSPERPKRRNSIFSIASMAK